MGENFCTDRDDEIRQKDAPERFFAWNVPFHGSQEGGDLTAEDEEEEAIWIMQKIPEIQAEYRAPYENMEVLEQRETSILQSLTLLDTCIKIRWNLLLLNDTEKISSRHRQFEIICIGSWMKMVNGMI